MPKSEIINDDLRFVVLADEAKFKAAFSGNKDAQEVKAESAASCTQGGWPKLKAKAEDHELVQRFEALKTRASKISPFDR